MNFVSKPGQRRKAFTSSYLRAALSFLCTRNFSCTSSSVARRPRTNLPSNFYPVFSSQTSAASLRSFVPLHHSSQARLAIVDDTLSGQESGPVVNQIMAAGVPREQKEGLKQWYIGSIDQGTTSSRFLIFDGTGSPVASHQIEFKQMYPHSG